MYDRKRMQIICVLFFLLLHTRGLIATMLVLLLAHLYQRENAKKNEWNSRMLIRLYEHDLSNIRHNECKTARPIALWWRIVYNEVSFFFHIWQSIASRELLSYSNCNGIVKSE